MIPISIVTGFLGSGKTTLISRVLRDPAFGRTAVIVNEFGEIGLDHELIASSTDSVITLNTGCLCCAVQSDLGRTVMDLLARRNAGTIVYDRVLIETSGLSDPAPVLQTMMTDTGIAATHQAPYIVTVVDTIHGEKTLLDHLEARHQVALADQVLISKTDLRSPSEKLLAELDGLNPDAARSTTGQVNSSALFGHPSVDLISERMDRLTARPRHRDIETVAVVRDQPIPALALTLLLQAVADHCGPRLLRLKGLVSIEEVPGRPAVIHGVRHVVSAPAFLDRWPTENERTRIVLITKGVPRYFVSRLMDAIEEEVRDENAAFASRSLAVPVNER